MKGTLIVFVDLFRVPVFDKKVLTVSTRHFSRYMNATILDFPSTK